MNFDQAARKTVQFLLFFLFPVVMQADQDYVFKIRADNLIMASGSDTSIANTVYPNSKNSVGINHSYYMYYDYVAGASLLFFDLSAIAGRSVKKAYLYLYVTTLSGDPYGAANTTDYKISAISESWNTQTVTWNNQPHTTYLYEKKFEVPLSSSAPTVIEVTEIVKNWVSGTWVNYGFMAQDAYYQAQYCNCLYATNFGALGDSDSVLPRLFVTVEDNVPTTASTLMPVINYLLMN
jgi:hypothetical protein